MKNLKTYTQFINESKLPLDLYNVVKDSKLKWEEDSDMADELYDEHKGETSDAYVYIAKDKSRGREFVFKTWISDGIYNIQVEEDETVIFLQQYGRTEKKYYDVDCENILGFSF